MTTQDARMEGEDAFWEGKDESANPYDPSTDEHLSWNDGWHNASEQDEG